MTLRTQKKSMGNWLVREARTETQMPAEPANQLREPGVGDDVVDPQEKSHGGQDGQDPDPSTSCAKGKGTRDRSSDKGKEQDCEGTTTENESLGR